ncbi:MAG: single-stranded DNA-binding protein [Bifidobacterium psychraerophilum]|uniref:single-stranded DNA-binding protein n=1 Tax=Bifidobacterium psychraerophilum TaxID=218140 RepID=UPI0039EC433D
MGIQQGHVTINGYVAKEPRSIGEGGRTPMCTFRLASTRAYFDSKTHSWKDLATTWISVKAYRALATNIVASLRTGDPVIVTGLLGTDEWNRKGEPQSSLVIEASAVGHDLGLGTSLFTRSRRESGSQRDREGDRQSDSGEHIRAAVGLSEAESSGSGTVWSGTVERGTVGRDTAGRGDAASTGMDAGTVSRGSTRTGAAAYGGFEAQDTGIQDFGVQDSGTQDFGAQSF